MALVIIIVVLYFLLIATIAAAVLVVRRYRQIARGWQDQYEAMKMILDGYEKEKEEKLLNKKTKTEKAAVK